MSEPRTLSDRRTVDVWDGLGPIARAVRDSSPSVRATMLHWLPWRSYGTFVLACVDPLDIDGVNDERIGEMATEVIAEEVVRAHNSSLRQVDPPNVTTRSALDDKLPGCDAGASTPLDKDA